MSTTAQLGDRYGTPSPRRRQVLLGAVVLLVLVSGAWLAWTTFVHATPVVTSQLVGFEVVDENTATADLEVDLDDGLSDDDAAAARCTVRALAEDKAVVGQTTITPETGLRRETVTIRTERMATSVESLGCTAPGQNRPR